jgi:GDP-mannose 6-dehydrogenase
VKIAVFGLGYVGSVTAVCLAADGHEVWGVDKDETKVNRLRNGIAPIREPGLDEGLAAVLKAKKLTVTRDSDEAVEATDLAFVCVGTPTSSERGTDTSFVLRVIGEIGTALKKNTRPYAILLRSTVPPGTTRDLVRPKLEEASGRRLGEGLELYFNPEFLRQGSALADFHEAPFTIIGTPEGGDRLESDAVQKVYEEVDAPMLVVNYQEAELLKLACNAYHALKIDFANEIGALAQRLDADPTRVMSAFAMDTKLNVSSAYLRPGFAFGGSCLPKDVRSLNYIAAQLGVDLPVHRAILPSNDGHLTRIAAQLIDTDYQTIGMVGLVFKPNTDDLRESPAMRLVEKLLAAGKEIIVHEPEINVELLIGANLQYLKKVLPSFAERLVDWDGLRERSDMLLITRSGIVSEQDIDRIGLPVINLSQLGTRKVHVQ